ncbi:unnamed protein product [Coffea canephora]|uniref:DH200=94 genomic scaffold, scaffold_2810 n=1 Tax=Coffea canephora TaxID=49390 RepID=A0A068VKU2_COFCA|nr:unnamed protein product [Coffea canephora]
MDLARNIGDHTGELFQAQAHIWNHMFNFINSMSLKCAIQLGIPDVIHKHGQPMTLDQLIDALPIKNAKAPFVYLLMQILIHSGFFIEAKIPGNENDNQKGYLLTSAAELLLKSNPFSMTPLLLFTLDPTLTDPWHHLSQWFQNSDETPFYTCHGRSLYDLASHEPRLNQFFNEAMASDTRLVSSVVTKDCKHVFEGLNSLVDVGGNMFEAIPPADAVLMKWILIDWSDDECVQILKKCKEAIPSKEKRGKVIIVEMFCKSQQKGDDDHEAIETQLFFDMAVMVLVKGRQRNEKDWAKLFTEAGFSDYKITAVLGLRSIIEVYHN